MAEVRGVAVLNAIQFVRETYGPAGHDRVLHALPAERCGRLLGPLREGSWEPLDDFNAYLEAAQRVLDSGDPDFHRRLGFFSGRLERESQGFGVMVAEPAQAMRMGPVVWRSFWSVGRLEVEVLGPREGVARAYDFPATRALCDRTCGAWEGLLSRPELPCRTRETRCVVDGHPFCEYHAVWRGADGEAAAPTRSQAQADGSATPDRER